VVGSLAALTAWRYVDHLSRTAAAPEAVPLPQPAFASGRTALAAQMAAEESPSALAPDRDSR